MSTVLDPSLADRIIRLSPEKRMVLEQRMTSAVARDSHPVPGGDVVRAPTSFGQRSQWFVHRLDPDNPFFNKTDAVRIRGPLQVDTLRRAVSALVARHAVLRTCYRATEEGPVQLVDRASAIEVPVVEIPPGRRQSADLHRYLAAEQRRPFEIENGPMYRVKLIRLGADDHVLARTSHHIAFDRWSSAIANAELSELYRALAVGEAPRLEPLPYQYSDFAVWQRSHLDPATIGRHLEFAAAHLAGVSQVLDLPTDHTRPASHRHQGASYSTSLDRGLVRKVRERARGEGATPFMVCMAGFAVLLGKYARTDQFLLGVPTAGRTAAGSEALIGLFINSMVLRLDLRGEPSFSELVARVRAAALGAMSHQDLPFDILVEKLAKQRMPGRTPMFQVMLDYINTPAAELALGSLELEPVRIADEASVYDVNLYLYDDGTDIRAKWEYRSDLFDRPTIVRMSAAYATVLEAAVTDPGRPVNAIPLVSSEDRTRIQALGTGPTIEAPLPGSFLATIRRQSTERGDAAAIVAGDTVITYEQLWNQVAEVSRTITATCPPHALIALQTGRSVQFVPALLGVLHAGRTAVMVDTAQPEPRLASMLDQVDLAAKVAPGDHGIPEVEVVGGFLTQPDPGRSSDDQAQAYVVFTSGSAGAPRPVAVGCAALENFVADACERYRLGSEDKVLQFASPGFDTLLEEVLPTLASGATLVMRPVDLFSSFAGFTRFVADHDITVVDLPTSWWHAWVDDMVRTGETLVPDHVRLVIIGGEAARTDSWIEWQRITDRRIRLVNTYGPSEATVVVATFEPRPGWTPTTEIMPIGLPIRNTRMLVVDQAGELVPLGLPGELVIEGAPVGSGHIGRTGRRSGFAGAGDGTARRYYTGDLARVSVDGIHEYLGRLDDQVKVSGIRIEPGEIEAALRTHQAVSDAVVLGVADGGRTGLVAHVLSPAPVDEKAIQSHLLDRLPATMIPGSMVTHSAFPMTTSGKVDRVALSEHAPHRSDEPEATGAERPLTITEQRLNRVWRALMPQASLRLDDDFFAIGGHSLLGVRLISRAAEEFGLELPLRVIYEAPTVATMASWIDDLLDELPPDSATSHRGDVDHGTT